MIKISKEDTYNGLFDAIDSHLFVRRLSFLSKTRHRCLKCGKELLMDFTRVRQKDLFCEEHQLEANSLLTNHKEKVLQAHYMRRIKEKQLQIVEQTLNKLI